MPIKTVGGGTGGGNLVLIEKQSVTGSDVSSVTFSSLDGDTDENYYLVGYWLNSYNGANNLYLEPNGLTTNLYFDYLLHSAAHGDDTTWAIAYASALSGQVFFWAWIQAKSGRYRTFTSEERAIDLQSAHRIGQWKDNSTNLTSLVLESQNADGIGVDSEFILYKLTPV
jgi:hypothetical protein